MTTTSTALTVRGLHLDRARHLQGKRNAEVIAWPSAQPTLLKALSTGQQEREQKGNQDTVMASSTLEEGNVFSKRNLALFPAQLLTPALLEMPTMHKPLPPQLLQAAQGGL